MTRAAVLAFRSDRQCGEGLTATSLASYHPCRWFADGNAEEKDPVNRQGDDRAARPADSEKITINLGFVDLGNIDLLVAEGFYSNRTDLIRTAIRAQLERHADVLKQSTSRKQLDLGLQHYSREQLELVRAAGRTIDIRVVGLARIAADVSPELARATIASVNVLGALQASSAVRAALADRMKLP
jgi:Arc/MetJ-type ribon-helix-helix transcriptional regulator